MILNQPVLNEHSVKRILEKGSSHIAPLWPLDSFVAVNPYLHMADMKFGEAMDHLNKSGNVQATLPIPFYLKAIKEGRLTRADLKKALEDNNYGLKSDVDEFIGRIKIIEEEPNEFIVRTISELASLSGKKWHRFMVDRISFWASSYFDIGQATWNGLDQKQSPYTSWKQEAEIDRAPELTGLKGFRAYVKNLPNDHIAAAKEALIKLDLSDKSTDFYLKSLLIKMNGWAGIASRMDWESKLKETHSQFLEEFLAILLVWEVGLKELLDYPELDARWEEAKQELEIVLENGEINEYLAYKLILQEAFDVSNQRFLIEKINSQKTKEEEKKKVDVQAVFCIDVRSETFRRNLEAANNRIETIGFAGFFGFPIEYKPLVHDQGSDQCPVLLSPKYTIKEALSDGKREVATINRRSEQAQVIKIWKAFKQSAISCFSFVSPLGLFFLPKLFSDAFGFSRPVTKSDQLGLTKRAKKSTSISLDRDHSHHEFSGIPKAERAQLALSVLKAMSLTKDFAPIVLIAGHGSTTVNNPHASGLDCGACGGNTGEANAKVSAAILNDNQVRSELKILGIHIPDETVFIPALHDTTTDEVQLFNSLPRFSDAHKELINELRYALNIAGEATRKERANRMDIQNGDIQKKILERSKDWSQVRPEWGLAGCSSFIVAPRHRTDNLNFNGKAFMHNYDWRKDADFSILELIMTAPMVVTSWINLQYYASTVDNKRFGSGNKTLHNVVGGMGVLEGFAGDLRVGLPWQSVSDGKDFIHEPHRLNVVIEAPVNEISKILDRHESIRNLCDNEWIYLFAINEQGKIAYKYIGDLQWEIVE